MANSGYDYDWQGIGLKIYTPSGSLFIQGEDGSALHDQLEECETSEEIAAILSEYEDAVEEFDITDETLPDDFDVTDETAGDLGEFYP